MAQEKKSLEGILAQSEIPTLTNPSVGLGGILSQPLGAGALTQPEPLDPLTAQILKGTHYEGVNPDHVRELIKLAGDVTALPKIDVFPVFTPGEQYKGPVGYMANAKVGSQLITGPVMGTSDLAKLLLLNRLRGR